MTPRVLKVGLFALAGFVAGVALLALASLFAAGGHGTSLPFVTIFPWNRILFRINPIMPDWLLSLTALLQMPMYALVIGISWDKGYRIAVLAGVVVLHLVAVAACHLPHRFYEAFW